MPPFTLQPPQLSRAIGCLQGLAIGDAVGTTLEFSQPNPNGLLPRSRWLTDMVGGGPFGLNKGDHTDDTSMALAMADSIAHNGWDIDDQMRRYLSWREDGKYSVKGRCFDIGGATSSALARYKRTGNPYAGTPNANGNGALMRLAPVPIYAAHMSPTEVAELAREESELTHGDDSADCCEAFAMLCYLAIRQASKAELLDPVLADVFGFRGKARKVFADRTYLAGPPAVTGSGYVVRTFEAALWAFSQTDNYRDAILLVTRLGRDTDTTAAVTGQLAGAHYNITGIPEQWRADVTWGPEISNLASAVWRRGIADAEAMHDDPRLR